MMTSQTPESGSQSHSSDNSTLLAYGEGGLLMIEPEDEASGTAEVFVQVIDEVGNIWTDSFLWK